MKKGLVFTALLILTVTGFCQAQGDLGIEVDATWVSKYIWRGYDVLDDKAAFQPSVSIDLFDTGFSFTVWASYPGSSKGGASNSTVNLTEYDYILTYSNSAFEGEAHQLDYAVNWIYYDLIENASKTSDFQELNIAVAMPQICGFGIVPHYTAAYLWTAKGGGVSNTVGGWIHEIGLDYNLVLGEIIPNNPEQILTFSWDITYNGGAGAISTNPAVSAPAVDHDWSHMTFGLSTEFVDPFGGKIRPGVYWQKSMEDTVNNEDELWTGLSYTLSF